MSLRSEGPVAFVIICVLVERPDGASDSRDDFEGMRPGELDALRWEKIDFQAGTILVDEQWNAIDVDRAERVRGVL
jgi:hypothetical protein